MGLKTTNVPDSGIPREGKTLDPGNQKISITGATLREPPYKKGEGLYELVLEVRGPELPDFEGFQVDKDDPSKGFLKWKVARVKASQWAFSDGTTKTGIEISRDLEILKFIKAVCNATGTSSWFDAQDDKHSTIEAFMDAFNREKPFLNKEFHACIAGKEYKNAQGYNQFDLFFPKSSKQGVPFSADPTKVLKFNPEEHILRKKNEATPQFEPAEDPFSKDPEGGDEFRFPFDDGFKM